MTTTFLCWKWKPRDSFVPPPFTSDDVNLLEYGLRHTPHRLICFTDDTKGIKASVECLPIWDDGTPGCLRRMQVFSPEFPKYDEYMVSIDLDAIVLKDLTPLFQTDDPLKIWESRTTTNPYNGSLWRFKHGCYPSLSQWSKERDEALRQPINVGTDQAWIHMNLPDLPTWTWEDGVYAYKHNCQDRLPANAKVVFFPGKPKATSPRVIRRHDWVRNYYE